MYEKEGKIGNIKDIMKDTMIISIGLFVSSFGTALFYEANMGSGAMATFCDGIHKVMNITYGQANILMNVILLLVLFFCDRRYINIGTLLCVFAIGIFVDASTWILTFFPFGGSAWGLRFAGAIAGTVLMGAGLGLYVAVDRGFGALEGLVKYVAAKRNWEFGRVKIAQDVILIALGIALQAAWGIGTVISAFLVGPIMQWSIKWFRRLLRKDINPERNMGTDQINRKKTNKNHITKEDKV